MSESRAPGRPEQAALEVVIRADGRVVFRALTDEMLDVARAVAPNCAEVEARCAMREESRKRGER